MESKFTHPRTSPRRSSPCGYTTSGYGTLEASKSSLVDNLSRKSCHIRCGWSNPRVNELYIYKNPFLLLGHRLTGTTDAALEPVDLIHDATHRHHLFRS